jgi:large repetitive protein
VPSTLAAKQRVTIPYRIVALQSLDAPTGGASGAGCYSYSNSLAVTCKFQCANGTVSNCGSSASWFSFSNSTCPTGSTGGVPAPGGGGWSGGGSGGWGGAGTSTPLPLRGKKCVYVPKGEFECE